MFREMKRKKQALSAEECRKLLTEEKRGVLSVIGDGGYPCAGAGTDLGKERS